MVYRARIIRRQEDKLIADSKEAAAKNLPPEQRAACVERQAGTMPRKDDVSSTSMSATLYPDWVLSRLVSVRAQTRPNCTGRLGKAWTLQGATMPIRPKTELIATSTRPAHLVRRAAGWNLIANPTGLLRRPFEGRILCSNEWHTYFVRRPTTLRFTQGHGIHSQRSLVVHRRV